MGRRGGRTVWLLSYMAPCSTNAKGILSGENPHQDDINYQFLTWKVKDLKKQQDSKFMSNHDIKIDKNWRADVIFQLPFEVEPFFVDQSGEKVEKRPIRLKRVAVGENQTMHCSARFWLKDVTAREEADDSCSDDDLLWDDQANRKRKGEFGGMDEDDL